MKLVGGDCGEASLQGSKMCKALPFSMFRIKVVKIASQQSVKMFVACIVTDPTPDK